VKLNHIQQPENSRLCGQTVVAMLAGITLDQSIAEFNDKIAGTYHRELTRVLLRFGWKPQSERLIKFRKGVDIPEICLIKVWWDRTGSTHWALKYGNILHDPCVGHPIDWTDNYLAFKRRTNQHRMTSFLEFRK